MGMDLSGINPINDSGVYFSANIWSWRPIHELIWELGEDLIDKETLVSMGGNNGRGPESGEVCRILADRFTIWLEHHTEGYSLDIGCHIMSKENEHGGHAFATTAQAEDPNVETESAHKVHDEHLQEFVIFLRNCGGFQVW